LPFDLNSLFGQAIAGDQDCIAPGQSLYVITPAVRFDPAVHCPPAEWPDTFKACGFAMQSGICLPPGGGEVVSTGECSAKVTVPCPCQIEITKEVACSPDGPFSASVTALRGATVYFKITVTNKGGTVLNNVTITDTFSSPSGACQSGGIPPIINVGSLQPAGQPGDSAS